MKEECVLNSVESPSKNAKRTSEFNGRYWNRGVNVRTLQIHTGERLESFNDHETVLVAHDLTLIMPKHFNKDGAA